MSRSPHPALPSPSSRLPTRRTLVRGAAATLGAAGLGLLGQRAWSADGDDKPLTLSWTGTGLCLSPIVVANELGYFEKNNVKVNIINFAGATDQVLESIATGKADISLGLIHAWLKPLEAGFDVKVVGTAHAGCIRVLAPKGSGIASIEAVKGKTIGVASPAGYGRQFFSTALARRGVNPEQDVQWRVYPADQLDVAVKKGEIDVIADSDPNLYLVEKRSPGAYTEIANILKGDFKDRLCCIVAARGELVKRNPKLVAGVVRALHQAALFISDNPNEAGRAVSKLFPKVAQDDLGAILATIGYQHHTKRFDLTKEIESYAVDLKQVGVLKKTTDPARFAKFLTVDVLA
ncbi:ABC transporter substrate-binding protein [Variovorax sp. J22G73]|uniref:ABC transporter substrate-binding protein n=1 Tax=unclassified Variovorax TaxID=663243 RepID=UPI00257760A0|nr:MULTISPECIES: ABC transporter substrate-binding protein [unclassified Variovorax]MDM0005812.1 ABC transporter substrate-binding protein [Variovorax sp. J22R203]MDM0099839.1 ABC transporter substrate-binding protein [Variovorax sp. J22G73]